MAKGKVVEVFERYEMKYLMTTAQYEAVLHDLLQYMDVDAYSQKTGFYPICNIYYDTPDNLLIRQSIAKPFYKEKMRLRSYGNLADKSNQSFLEIKKKYDKLVSKRRIVLSLGEAETYMATGEHPTQSRVNGQILREMDYFRQIYPMLPKLYLSYNRKALAGKEDPEFRVTFDRDITVRREDLRLDSDNAGRQLLPDGVWLMEIKVLDAMPLWCARILSKYDVMPTSFSKYGTEYMMDLGGQTLEDIVPDFFIRQREQKNANVGGVTC